MVKMLYTAILIMLLAAVCAYAQRPRDDARIKSIRLVAAVILSEAGGEGPEGMFAVAQVIKNRVNRRGLSPHEVVTRPAQFKAISLWLGYGGGEDNFVKHCKEKWPAQWSTALGLSQSIHDGSYITNRVGRATLFCTDSSRPNWRTSPKTRFVCRIGNHVFYEEV